MRSARTLFLIGAIVAFAALAPAAAAAPPRSFHVAKDCDGLTCVITASTYRGIPTGTVITYTENPDGSLTSVINVAHGSATGRCVLDPIFGDPSFPGTCVFASGTGSLSQLHLVVNVTTSDFVTWYWDGSYWIGNEH